VRIRNDAVTVYGSFSLNHWKTGKERETLNEVRRPACHVDDRICCLRIGFPAIMYTGRIPLYPVVYMNNVVENCRSNAAVLYCNNITKKEEES